MPIITIKRILDDDIKSNYVLACRPRTFRFFNVHLCILRLIVIKRSSKWNKYNWKDNGSNCTTAPRIMMYYIFWGSE